ncbi:MAG: ribonuclease E/G, partial [Acidimicrobiia bacterium]
MALFRRKSAEVVRRGVGEKEVEERTTRRVGRDTVEVRRVRAVPQEKARTKKSSSRTQKPRPPARDGRRRTPRHVEEEIILPPETGKKQMLVRVLPSQTQVVILEGPSLVEHYVARQERTSLAGNMYLAKVKNVLPGMEAAFLDFGEPKNGVLYAGDLKVDPSVHGRHPRIEQVLSEGDEVLVQVVKDAMGAKGARLTGQVTVPGRYLVLAPDSDMQGISRRLPEEDRLRLRDILREVKPEGFGVIVRTAAASATKDEIEADINRLVRVWNLIKEEAAQGGAPRPVYEEPGLLIRVIREHFTPDFKRLLIDDETAREDVVS